MSRRYKLAFAGGDFQPYLVRAGRWLVYAGDGIMAIRDDLMGKPRVLGSTPFFAPAASPGHVWLERFSGADPAMGRGRASAWQVSVRTGRRGPVITLPRRSFLLEGTDAGLLLKVPQEQDFGLALWRPGSALRALPYSPLAGGLPDQQREGPRIQHTMLLLHGDGRIPQRPSLTGYLEIVKNRRHDGIRVRNYSPPRMAVPPRPRAASNA